VILALWAAGLVRRRWGRLLGVGSAVALVVGLTGALSAFAIFARAEVGRRATAGVDVDWQIQVAPGTSARDALQALRPPARASRIVGYGEASAFRAASGGTVQTTGAGKVIGLPPEYRATFPAEIRDLVGARSGVLLTQQTASNLHAAPGTVVEIVLDNHAAVKVRIDGIVDMPNADSFFQVAGARAGVGPTAPPDDVLILPLDRWRKIYGADGATQLHVKLARHLPRDPAKAFAQLTAERNNYQVRMSGGAVVGDNLAARLDSARSDATYGQLLFLFLGLPGVLLGAVFASFGAAVGADRRRNEQAILRARGASPALLAGAGAVESALVWITGSVTGTLAAWVVSRALWHTTPVWLAGPPIGLAATLMAVLRPALRDARRLSVGEARRTVYASAPRRVGIAFGWLAALAAGVVVWITTRQGYQIVLAPEGTPSISVNYLSLLGPVLAWFAGVWVIAAAAGALLVRGHALTRRMIRPVAGNLAGVVAAWMTRLRGTVVRAVLLLAVAVAFAISAAVFDASFSAQSRLDAELTNGADVAAFVPPGVALQSAVPQVARIPGVADVEPMQHRFAYVGNDLQDLYGVRPGHVGKATAMSDAFFGGGHAKRKLDALARMTDGVYVSDETVKDFALSPGDSIKIRLLDARTRAYVPVAFHLLGIVREFPTAPTDSFLVANASYVSEQTHSAAAETLLVRAGKRSPAAIAADMRRIVPNASVRDIVEQRRITATGLVALDLSGLSALNLAFGAVGVAWTIGLLVSVGFVERRRHFAILRAVGAKRRHIAAFAATETGGVVIAGSVAGAVLGGGIAWILVSVLRGVFDPPPAHPVVPWVYLVVLAVAAVTGFVAAIVFTLGYAARLGPETLRELAL